MNRLKCNIVESKNCEVLRSYKNYSVMQFKT